MILDSDALGKLGEDQFKLWCSSTNLTCNRSLDWDRAGWDFELDFEFDESPGDSLDRRKGPISCRVQQKTIWHTSDSVRLSLRMAERLAKETGPSFISVIKIGEDKQPVDAYLIHMRGERLAAVLKRLREVVADATGLDLKDKTISFIPTPEERIGLSGAALRAKLVEHIGQDMHAYVERKQQERKTLGYEAGPYVGTFQIAGGGDRALGDLFLGLRKNLDITDVEVFETRFGVTLPETSGASATLSLEPSPFSDGVISFFAEDSIEPALLPCQAFASPVGADNRIVLKSQFLECLLEPSAVRVRLGLKKTLVEKQGTPTEWATFWRAMSIYESKRGTVEIEIAEVSGHMSFDLSTLVSLDGEACAELFLSTFEVLQKIEGRGGLVPGARLDLIDVFNAREDIGALGDFLSGECAPISIGVSEDLSDAPTEPGDFLVFRNFHIGRFGLAYYLRGTSAIYKDKSGYGMRLDGLSVKRMATVSTANAYQHFIDSAKKREGVEQTVIARYAELKGRAGGVQEMEENSDSSQGRQVRI